MLKEWKYVYVIYRIDHFLMREDREALDDVFKVKSVISHNNVSEEEIRVEVERLNSLNSDKGCRYYWNVSKFYEEI